MFALSEKEKKGIVQAIGSNLEDYVAKYPLSKFPDEPYEEWKTLFADAKAIKPEDIKSALTWMYGHHDKHHNVKSHKAVVEKVQEHWGEFVALGSLELNRIFNFWHAKMPELPFVAPTSFIAHLLLPDLVPNMDKFHFLAMNELISQARPTWQWRSRPNSVDDIKTYAEFVHMIAAKVEAEGNKKRLLDKYLRVYGSVIQFQGKDTAATSRGRREATIKEFSWEAFSPRRFDGSKIMNRSNADVLFACLLMTLDENEEHGTSMTIQEIADKIPIGTGGISIYASYQYAMIGLFGQQKNRDYFVFDKPELAEQFTKQANNPSRDINFWKNYLSETISINPVYVV
jgi:hypothetical protein